eukprot:TRINITY_DN84617_c0_g1_i1.p1 TRINITY_DN84617_c0_g1~~TRINITY_DN84617_c0_g1_i1.p1  ORF type:complete len:290 (-),score=34.61 TRINITY_DN84617_c0_g1_i1:59-928(-)
MTEVSPVASDFWFYLNNALYSLFVVAMLCGETVPLLLQQRCIFHKSADQLTLIWGFDTRIEGFSIVDPLTNTSHLLLAGTLCWIRPSAASRLSGQGNESMAAVAQATVIGLQTWFACWFFHMFLASPVLGFDYGPAALIYGTLVMWTSIHRSRNPAIYGVEAQIFGQVLNRWRVTCAVLLSVACPTAILLQGTIGKMKPCTLLGQEIVRLPSICLPAEACHAFPVLPYCFSWPNTTAHLQESCLQAVEDLWMVPAWVAQASIYALWAGLVMALRSRAKHPPASLAEALF